MFACSREYAEGIKRAIAGEMAAINFYRCLLQMAQDRTDRKIISGILQDEERHYRTFCSLYQSLTDSRPDLRQENPQMPRDYLESLFAGVISETDTADFYSELIVATQDLTIRDLIFEIMVDELRHASLLNLLYAKNNCHHHDK